MNTNAFNIFYTDDDRDDIAFFRDAIREIKGDIELNTQYNGNDLIQMLENPPPYPSLLFLDWNMPGKDGEFILKAIRSDDRTKDLPVVIFSTSNYSGHIEKARSLGANLYATKPNSFQALVKLIQKVVSIDWKSFQPTREQFVFSAT